MGKVGVTMKALLAAALLLIPSLALATDGPDSAPAQPAEPQPQMAPPTPPKTPSLRPRSKRR